ncbi:MAG: SGNH/GDSL hydrolase family protein [Bacteroidales bacterium]|nr:SGNH/GDSL hydrolase family protein [Bacteroidales bacterium]
MARKGILSAFGDSIVKGVVPEQETAASYRLLEQSFLDLCGARFDMPTANYGRFGSTVTVGQKILDRHLDALGSSSITLLEFGGNDCDYDWGAIGADPEAQHLPHTGVEQFRLIYKDIIDKVRFAGSEPVLLTLPPLDPDRYYRHVCRDMDERGHANVLRWLGGNTAFIFNWHEIYNLEVLKIAAALRVRVADITGAFLARRSYSDLLCADGIHPNEQGHRLIADTLCTLLKHILPNPASGACVGSVFREPALATAR